MSKILQTGNLTKKFRKQVAVNRVSLNIEKGDIYGLIGKNGAGKTTIMKMACGLIHPNQGTLRLFESNNLEKGRERMGCMIEQPALYPGMTARQNLVYYKKLLGISDKYNIDDVLHLVGLQNTGKKQTKNFSLGMKQRLSIAISLLGNPDFLILDEPTNGLDPYGIKEIRELILKINREHEITILISSHILGELSKIATKYGVLQNGMLVEEFAAVELENRCKKCILLTVDDLEKAAYILKSIFKINDFHMSEQGKLCIYNCLDIPAQINKTMVENGISISCICLEDNDIESYFVKLMRGEK